MRRRIRKVPASEHGIFDPRTNVNRRRRAPTTLRTEYDFDQPRITPKRRIFGLTTKRLKLALDRGSLPKGKFLEHIGEFNDPETGRYLGTEMLDRRKKIHRYNTTGKSKRKAE